MKVSDHGLALIKAFEGCHRAVKGQPGYFKAYSDPVGVLTIGYGHTHHHPPHFDKDTVWSQNACDAVLAGDLATFERHVEKLAKVPLKQHEFDALVSWAFNTGGPETASLWKVLNAGHKRDVAEQLARWNKAGGRVLNGLIRRREAEAAMFDGDLADSMRIAGVRSVPKPIVAEPVPPPPDVPPIAPKPRGFWASLISIFKRSS